MIKKKTIYIIRKSYKTLENNKVALINIKAEQA